jgi:hypothetical protein
MDGTDALGLSQPDWEYSAGAGGISLPALLTEEAVL